MLRKLGVLKAPMNLDDVYSVRKGVKIIGKRAFDFCNFLTNIIIPESVTNIGDWAFSNCI